MKYSGLPGEGSIIVRWNAKNKGYFFMFKVIFIYKEDGCVKAKIEDCINEKGKKLIYDQNTIEVSGEIFWRFPTEGELDMYNKVFSEPEKVSQTTSNKGELENLNKALSADFYNKVKLDNPAQREWAALNFYDYVSKFVGGSDAIKSTGGRPDVGVLSIDLETDGNPFTYKAPTTYGRFVAGSDVVTNPIVGSYINNFVVKDTIKSKELSIMAKIFDLSILGTRPKQKFTPEYKCRWK